MSKETLEQRLRGHYLDEVPEGVPELLAENERLKEAIKDAIRYVQTGGPLYTKDRLELIANLRAALEEDDG
jgi:hypothetical protein